jgi:hypothetical protein
VDHEHIFQGLKNLQATESAIVRFVEDGSLNEFGCRRGKVFRSIGYKRLSIRL